MDQIREKELLSPHAFRMKAEAPGTAQNSQAGPFAIISTGDTGERSPLSVAGADSIGGWTGLVMQTVGRNLSVNAEFISKLKQEVLYEKVY